MAETDSTQEKAQERAPRTRRRRSTGEPTVSPPLTEPKTEAKAPGKPIVGLQKKLENFLVGCGLPFAAAGDMHCAMIFAQRGPVVAEAWANLAAESPAVKRLLESMLKGGAWAGAIGSTAALVFAIGSHHGMPMPDVGQMFGIGTPEEPQSESNGHPPESHIFVAPQEGPAVPGPAAVSLPNDPTGDKNLTDPANYPGPHNSPEG